MGEESAHSANWREKFTTRNLKGRERVRKRAIRVLVKVKERSHLQGIAGQGDSNFDDHVNVLKM